MQKLLALSLLLALTVGISRPAHANSDCSTALTTTIQDNRSLETLEDCLKQLPDNSRDRAEIQRQLALIYYDRIGSLSSDRLPGKTRAEKLQTLEQQLEQSQAIAIANNDISLESRIQYTLGQIRANELDRFQQPFDKSDDSDTIQSQINALEIKFNDAIAPFRKSDTIEAKLYRARLLLVTLPQFYRALEIQSSKFSSKNRPSREFDRSLKQTQAWQIELLQLLPTLQKPFTLQPDKLEAIDRILYHATTLSRVRPLQDSIIAFQNTYQVYAQTLPASDPMSVPLWSQVPAVSLQRQAQQADRSAADLLLQVIQATQVRSGETPADAKLLNRQHIQAKLALIDLYPASEQAKISQTLITPNLLLEADGLNSPELAAQVYGRYAKSQLDLLNCKTLNDTNRAGCQNALQASENAIRRTEAVRGDLLSLASDVQYSYRESVETLYRDNLDLQFAQANPNLEKILTRLESLKLAEIHNYFREPCIEAKVQLNQFINQNLPNTHLIYMVVLDDRLEVITKLSNSNQLRRFQTQISRNTIKQEALQFRNDVSIKDQAHSPAAQQLYQWIFQAKDAQGRSLEESLNPNSTLVMIADSGLRNIPFAALSRSTATGDEHLIDRFSIVLSPGLTLFEPKPVRSPKILFAAQRDFPGFSPTDVGPLPGTERELDDLKAAQLLPAQAPSNQILFTAPKSPYQVFNRANFETAVTEESFNVVHIATHGKFSSDQEQTFLIMGDERVNTADFSNILQKRDRKRSESIELLILSACETADGDDRADLGLAGLALRSGARSTIAGLWRIADAPEVTPKLLLSFYQDVFKNKRNKAEALRQAQLELKRSNQSIALWAPFVLVGNWL